LGGGPRAALIGKHQLALPIGCVAYYVRNPVVRNGNLRPSLCAGRQGTLDIKQINTGMKKRHLSSQTRRHRVKVERNRPQFRIPLCKETSMLDLRVRPFFCNAAKIQRCRQKHQPIVNETGYGFEGAIVKASCDQICRKFKVNVCRVVI
jgi:hypothetical protein